MADYNDEKTVIVDRSDADRSSPVGWIILIVVLLIVAIFALMNNMNTAGGDSTDTTDTSDTSPSESTLPADDVTPDAGINMPDADTDIPGGSATPPVIDVE